MNDFLFEVYIFFPFNAFENFGGWSADGREISVIDVGVNIFESLFEMWRFHDSILVIFSGHDFLKVFVKWLDSSMGRTSLFWRYCRTAFVFAMKVILHSDSLE